MPPEQASGRLEQVKETADVYALGATLYALLTGRPPFQAANPVDTLLQVISTEPVSLRQLNSRLPRDLETICHKCLDKDPRQRYATATAFAEDVRRYLDGRPILARPIGRAARTWRWCRRNPVVSGLLALTTGFLLIAVLALRGESQQRRLAQEQSETYRRHNYNAQMSRAWPLIQESPEDAWAVLGNPEQCVWPMLDFSWRLLDDLNDGRRPVAIRHGAPAQAIAFSSDGDAVAILAGDHVVFWDLAASTIKKFPRKDAESLVAPGQPSLAISADKQGLLMSTDKNIAFRELDQSFRSPANPNYLWNDFWQVTGETSNAQGSHLTTQRSFEPVLDAGYSDDGLLLATASSADVRIWRRSKSNLVKNYFIAKDRIPIQKNLGQEVRGVRFLPNGRTLEVSLAGRQQILVKISQNDRASQKDVPVKIPGELIAVSSDSSRGVVESESGRLELRDTATGNVTGTPRESRDKILAAGFRRGEPWPVLVDDKGRISAWSTGDQGAARTVTLEDWPSKVRSVCFSPGGERLLADDDSGTIRVWDPTTGKLTHQYGLTSSVVVAFTSDSAHLATSCSDGKIRYWDLTRVENGEEVRLAGTAAVPGTYLSSLAFSPGKGLGIGAAVDGRLLLCEPLTADAPPSAVRWLKNFPLRDRASGIVFRNGESLLELDYADGLPDLVDFDSLQSAADSGAAGHDPPSPPPDDKIGNVLVANKLERAAYKTALSPDGKAVAVAAPEQWLGQANITLYDVASRRRTQVLSGHRGRILFLAFTPDGKSLVSASRDNSIRFWDPVTGDVRLLLTSHSLRTGKYSQGAIQSPDAARNAQPDAAEPSICSAALSRNGRFLAIGYDDGVAQLWAAKPACMRGRVVLPGRFIHQLTFSPDGRQVVCKEGAGWDSGWSNKGVSLACRDALTFREVDRLPAIANGNSSEADYSVSPGAIFAVAEKKPDTLQFWDPRRVVLVAERPCSLEGQEKKLVFSPDGSAIAVTIDQGKTCVVYDRNGKELGRASVSQIAEGLKRMFGNIDKEPNTMFGNIVLGPRGEKCILRIAIVNHITDGHVDASLLSDYVFPSYLWETRSGKPPVEIPLPRESGPPQAFVNDGRWLAVESQSGRLGFFDLASGAFQRGQIDFLEPAPNVIRSSSGLRMIASGDGSRIAFFNNLENSAQVWDVPTQTLLLNVPEGLGRSFAATAMDVSNRRSHWAGFSLSHDGNLAALWAGNSLCVYDLSASALGADDPWLRQYRQLAAGSRGRFRDEWETNLKAPRQQSDGSAASTREEKPLAKLTDMAVHRLVPLADGRVVAAGWQKPTDRGSAMVFQPQAGNKWSHADLPLHEGAAVYAAAVRQPAAAGGAAVAFLATTDSNLISVDLAAPSQSRTVRKFSGNRAIDCLVFSPDRKLLAAAGLQGGIRLLDAVTGEQRKLLECSHVEGLAFRPDGKRMAAVGLGLTVWETDGWTPVASAREAFKAVAYSPDGKLLATVGGLSEREIDVRDAETNVPRRACHGHRGTVWTIAFHPASNLLASTSEDRTVRLWDPRSGRELAVFRGHSGAVDAVAFTSDGGCLVSGGYDGALLWKVPDAIFRNLK
jgi:WD40 repeat protein